MGRLMLAVVGAMGQAEREAMLERQREGIAKAKSEGRYKGRVPTVRRQAADIIRLKSEGVRPTEIASRLGIARASVYRALGAQNGDRVATDRAPIELLARPSISTNKPIDSIASNGTGHDQDGVGVRRAGAADSLVVSFGPSMTLLHASCGCLPDCWRATGSRQVVRHAFPTQQ
jgi:hypothetical protein